MKEILCGSNDRLVVVIRRWYEGSKGRSIVSPFSAIWGRICRSGGCGCLKGVAIVVALVVVIVVAVVSIGFFGFVSFVGVRSSTSSDCSLGEGCHH